MKRRRLKKAVIKSFCHHGDGGHLKALLFWGRKVKKMPPKPTQKEILAAEPIVKELLEISHDTFRQACIAVLGEDPDEDWLF